MVHSTILHNLTPEQFSSMFQELKREISELKAKLSKPKIEGFLTRQDVAEMLKCDLSTVHNWTKAGILIAYGIGNRVYYKLSDIESVMLPINKRRKSQQILSPKNKIQ